MNLRVLIAEYRRLKLSHPDTTHSALSILVGKIVQIDKNSLRGGVSKSMLTLNETIIDVKKG